MGKWLPLGRMLWEGLKLGRTGLRRRCWSQGCKERGLSPHVTGRLYLEADAAGCGRQGTPRPPWSQESACQASLSSIHCLPLTQDRRAGKGSRPLLPALLGVPGHRLPSQSLASRRGTAGAEPWPATSWLPPLSSKAQPVGKWPSGILPQLPGRMCVVAKAVDPAGKGLCELRGLGKQAQSCGSQRSSCSPGQSRWWMEGALLSRCPWNTVGRPGTAC